MVIDAAAAYASPHAAAPSLAVSAPTSSALTADAAVRVSLGEELLKPVMKSHDVTAVNCTEVIDVPLAAHATE